MLQLSNICRLFLFLCYFRKVQSEFFSAISDLEQLLYTENKIIEILQSNIKVREEKIELLKKLLSNYKKHNKIGKNDVLNPINAFALIRKLVIDLRQIENLISNNVSDKTANVTREIKTFLKFPTEDDLEGAMLGLIRLQRTYKLNMTLMTKGEIYGYKSHDELSAGECAKLAQTAYEFDMPNQAIEWLIESENLLRNEVKKTIDETLVLEYLCNYNFEMGNTKKSLDIANRWVKKFPDDSIAVSHKTYYEYALSDKISNKKRVTDITKYYINDLPYREFNGLVNALCRGDIEASIESLSELKCRYDNKNNPFLFIAPFKIEELSRNPNIYVFHDVITDEEIEVVKKFARVKFERAQVAPIETNDTESMTTDERVAKAGWLDNFEHDCINAVNLRVADMTGLSISHAETLQVLNYGIGGQDGAHHDAVTWEMIDGKIVLKEASIAPRTRTATLMFYMSTVEEGGATVFPLAKTRVQPRKGTAVFWYNLHPDGKGDLKSIHAACPVLIGSKWVMNKWIHEKGQEFIRPCPLIREQYDEFLEVDKLI